MRSQWVKGVGKVITPSRSHGDEDFTPAMDFSGGHESKASSRTTPKGRPTTALQALMEAPANHEPVESEEERQEAQAPRLAALAECMAELTETEQLLIQLKYLDSQSVRQVEKVLSALASVDASPTTFTSKSEVHRATKRAFEKLQKLMLARAGELYPERLESNDQYAIG